ncbi:g8619 [Coccomyxa elongata]
MMDISTLRHCGTPVAVKTACRRTRFPRHQTRAILRQHSPRPVAQPINPPLLRESEHLTAWTPESWQQFQAHQQPNYTELQKVTDALETISRLPALVFAGECRNLQSRLAKCATGEAFLVQGGDCAESFSQFSANRIRDSFRVQLQMALVAMFGGGVPVVKVGRMAGQFAKPRSSDTETFDGVELPSYRGDIINGQEFTAEARIPDPARMVQAYNQSAATLNLLRGFASGGYASLQRVMKWNLGFMDSSDKGDAYLEVAKRHDPLSQQINPTDFFTRLLCSIVYTGMAPQTFYAEPRGNEEHFDGLPVDFVSNIITTTALAERSGISTYHVVNPHWDDKVSLDAIVNWMESCGYKLRRFEDYGEWFQEFKAALESLERPLQSNSSLPIIHQWQKPLSQTPDLKFDAEQLRKKAQELTKKDIPSLDEAFVWQNLRHLAALQLISPPEIPL